MSEPADENEALREAEERFLENEAVSPDDQMGYTVEDDGTFYPEYGPYGKFRFRANIILVITAIFFQDYIPELNCIYRHWKSWKLFFPRLYPRIKLYL